MRYIGNKNKILSYIESLINDKNINKENYTFCDAFSGTATVGNYFKDKFKIIANDNLYTSFVMSNARLNTPDLKFEKLGKDPFEIFNDENNKLHGFIYNNFSPGGSERQYFSEDNAARIDYIRTKIEKWYNEDKITRNEYYYLIACLIESVSKVANVAGVYGSYLKMWDPRAVKPMQFIHVEQLKETALYENEIYNKNIEELIKDISGDILYLDPPYTKNQYSVQYHLLETISLYDEPELKGKTGARDNSSKTSKFSKPGEVHIEFEKIIAKANFKYIILSYSSDGIMSKEYIESVMKRYGKTETFEFRKFTYKQYLNSKAEKDEKHCEYLFYIEKKDKDEEVNYSSPLNYIGGKADMISFLKDNAPKNIDRIIDIFGGGFNVGINFDADQIIYNDCNFKVKELLEMLRNTDTLDLYKYISSMIKKYKLEKGEKEPYLKIRELYNNQPKDNRDPRLLYLLILFGYQQQIRFNSSYDYNNPVGQAGFNDKILEKLISYCRNLKEKNVVFMSKDFDDMWEHINENTFIYLDPPYLITLGSYNDGKRGFNGWTEKDEIKLLEFLSKINKMGVKFMLSNVLEHKEKKNELLIKWINDNGFKVIEYTEKARKSRKEVIIVNYDKEDKMIKLYQGMQEDLIDSIIEQNKNRNIIIVTDPPFNIGYHYNNYKDKMQEDKYYKMLNDLFKKVPSVVVHYPESLHKLSITMQESPIRVVSWVYNSNTAKQHRDIAFYRIKPDFKQVVQPYKNLNDKRIKERISRGILGGKLYDWWDVNQVKNVSKEKTIHPCQMPIKVMENIIGILPKDSLIVDPFMGSGTTGIACKNLGYDFIGIEADKLYYKVACDKLRSD